MGGYGTMPYGFGPYGGGGTIPFVNLYKEMIYTLLENGNADATGTSLITPMFTIADLQEAVKQRQAQFMRDTGILMTHTSFVTSSGLGTYGLPVDCSTPYRLAWQPAPQPSGGTSPLSKADEWSGDHSEADWNTTPGEPIAWTQTTQRNQTVRLMPAPAAVGQIDLIYVPLPIEDPLDATVLPVGFEIYIKWGALGDLFGREGESADPTRAAYCWQRWDEGVELARLLLSGPTLS